MNIELDMAQTVALAAVFLIIGTVIKKQVPLLSRYFIPSPIVGGLVFSIIALYGYQTGYFFIELYDNMRAFLLMAFFTTIGFSASFEMLKRGGIGVLLFLGAAIGLVIIQNGVGALLAYLLGENPLLGLAAGSVSLTGGHGTAGAFGPVLESLGVKGALPAAIAAATWGLVAGGIIGGPLGTYLLKKHNISGTSSPTKPLVGTDPIELPHESNDQANIGKNYLFDMGMYAVVLLTLCMGSGTLIISALQKLNIVVPNYLGAMLVAALVRNIIDMRGYRFPKIELEKMGEVSLGFFLVLALMSMKLWELADIAGPLLIILIVQTAVMFLYAAFVTFRVLGKDYDAVVMAAGHCGFGMGATPSAMANMQSFTESNGPSAKAFFVIPLVGSLFIDFFNALIITTFIGFL